MGHEIKGPDIVEDTDDKKMQKEESFLWKVCVLCEAYMRARKEDDGW